MNKRKLKVRCTREANAKIKFALMQKTYIIHWSFSEWNGNSVNSANLINN